MDSIRESIITSKLRIKAHQVRCHSEAVLSILPVETAKSSMYYILQQMKIDIPKVMIKVSLTCTGMFGMLSLQAQSDIDGIAMRKIA